MPATTTVQMPKIKFVPITPLEPGSGFIDYWTGIRNRIATCAYQNFESRGSVHGHDVDDWLQAESQVLKRVPVYAVEAEHLYTITADVSGFDADELEVSVEEFRLFIKGAKSDPSDNGDAQEIYEAIDLGQAIETNTVIAELSSGVLTISMRKAHMPSVVKVIDPNLKSSKTRSAQLRNRADIAKRYAAAAKDHLRRAVAKERKARMRAMDSNKAGIAEPTLKDPTVSWTEEAPHSPLG